MDTRPETSEPGYDFAPPAEGPMFGLTDPDDIEALDPDDIEEIDDFELVEDVEAGAMAGAQPDPLHGMATQPPIDDVPSDTRQTAPAPELLLDDDFTPPDVLTEDDAGGSSLEDDLDEADFFISQGLYDEAKEILDGLTSRYPNHPLIAAKVADLAAMAGGGAPVGGEVDTDFVPQMGEEEFPPERARSVVLEKPVDDEDADTHYDLGLAYKEMGLHDEAVKAFQKVIGHPGREVQCHLMIGLCHREQGNVSEAINQFKAGLYVDRISSAEKFDLYYEIGSAYEALRDPQEALYYYEMVVKKDPDYRDVQERVKALRSSSGGAHAGDGMGSMVADGGDRSR